MAQQNPIFIGNAIQNINTFQGAVKKAEDSYNKGDYDDFIAHANTIINLCKVFPDTCNPNRRGNMTGQISILPNIGDVLLNGLKLNIIKYENSKSTDPTIKKYIIDYITIGQHIGLDLLSNELHLFLIEKNTPIRNEIINNFKKIYNIDILLPF